MNFLSSILYILLSWHFAQPEPTVLAPPPHGFIPYYGFEESDSERFLPVLSLIHTGVYKVKEEDIGYYDREEHSSESFYNLSLSKNNDSVVIEEYDHDEYHDKDYLAEKQVYLKNGKLMSSLAKRNDGSIIWYFYFDPKMNASIKATPLNGMQSVYTNDSLFPENIKKYDTNGSVQEVDDIDKFGRISSKTLYSYDYNGNEIQELGYRIIQPLGWPKSSPTRLGKDSLSRAIRDSANREWHKAYLRWEEAYKLSNEYRLIGKIVYKNDFAKQKKETFNFYYDNYQGDSTTCRHSITYYDHKHREIRNEGIDKNGTMNFLGVTEYTDDAQGRPLTKVEHRNNQIYWTDKWSYDKNGHCTMHFDDNHQYTWEYDSKGNMIEFDDSSQGILQYKNKFKIYYK